MAPSTRKTYQRAWQLFTQCMLYMNIVFLGFSSLPLSINHILTFVGFMHLNGYSPSTMITYVSALGYVHRISLMIDPTSNTLVQKVLSAAVRLNPRTDPRLPITQPILFRLSGALNHTTSSPYLRVLFRAMYNVAFYGLMRVAEITQDKFGVIFFSNW